MQLKTTVQKMRVQFVPLHLSVRVSLTHLISIHVWASFIPLSQWCPINIYIFYMCQKFRLSDLV